MTITVFQSKSGILWELQPNQPKLVALVSGWFQKIIALENSWQFAAPTLVSSKMTSDWTTCQIEVVLQIGWKFALTNQKHYLIWQVVSSVWNFCTRFQTSFREKPVVALRKFGCFLRLNRTRVNSLTRLSFLGRHSNQKSHTTNGK